MMKRHSVNIGNYTSVAEILKEMAKVGATPENSQVEVETTMDQDSFGTEYAISEVYLRMHVEEKG